MVDPDSCRDGAEGPPPIVRRSVTKVHLIPPPNAYAELRR